MLVEMPDGVAGLQLVLLLSWPDNATEMGRADVRPVGSIGIEGGRVAAAARRRLLSSCDPSCSLTVAGKQHTYCSCTTLDNGFQVQRRF